MKRRSLLISAICVGLTIATSLMSSPAMAQVDKVKATMTALKKKADALGPPKIEGTDTVGDKKAPALYFGSTKMNNYFEVVDSVAKEQGAAVTLFVKAGEEYVRVATNVKKEDGSRAIGTILDPNGPVIVAIKKDEAFYGDTNILGKPYVTGYEPIRDSANHVLGIYFVGFAK
jgi:Cache 3/Cache 2 fusion domain